MTLLVHILAGSLGLISGFVALYTSKGSPVHRQAGRVFVYTMLPMCLAGLVLAVGRGKAPVLNVPAALVTAALVITALTTVRPPTSASRWLDRISMLVLLIVGGLCVTLGLQAVANGGTRNGMPSFPFLLFGAIGLLAGAGDLRMVAVGPPSGARRLARHLWRMSIALFVAALSFFIGQAQVIPEPLRLLPLRVGPVVLVLLTMVYWLWRVRVRPMVRPTRRGGALRPTAPPDPVALS